MGQQVGNHQDRLVLVLTDGDGDAGAVGLADHAVNGQGDGDPLILLDAAVVVGLEVCHLGIFVQGIGLQVHIGSIDMGGADIGTHIQLLSTDDGQSNGLVTVIIVNLITGIGFHAGDIGLEAQLLSLGHGPGSCLPLGLGSIHEGHITLGVGFHLDALLCSDAVVAVLGSGKQGFTEFFSCHNKAPFRKDMAKREWFPFRLLTVSDS